MSETPADRSHRFPSKRSSVKISSHAAQLLFAVILLGLDAYGIRFVAYSGLVYTLLVSICTIIVCAYSIICLSLLTRFYNAKVALGLHVLMLIFWLVDLGLVASLAKKWKQPQFVSVLDTGIGCSGDGRCDLKKVDHTSADTYAGALVAGAVLAAFEVVLWVATAGLLWLAMRVQTSSPPHQAESSSSRAQPTTVEATRNPPPHTEPWEHFATAPQGHMQPNAAELPQMSSPRTEAWENHVAVPPRSGPEPILPDSVDDDDAFSHYSQSPVSDGEDPEYTGGRREIIRNFGPQQAPYSGYDPYVRGVIIHQVPADGRSVRVETAQSPQFQVPSNWHVVN